MTRSLGELAALAKAAARGAGRDWGTAAEVGRAARWLAARGMDPTPALACLLAMPARPAPRDPRTAVWDAWDGPLCPVAAGLALADFAALGVVPARVHVAWPVLLRPFAADAGLRADAPRGAASAWVSPVPGAPDPACATRLRPLAWAALETLAARTRAPATRGSRDGAGPA